MHVLDGSTSPNHARVCSLCWPPSQVLGALIRPQSVDWSSMLSGNSTRLIDVWAMVDKVRQGARCGCESP